MLIPYEMDRHVLKIEQFDDWTRRDRKRKNEIIFSIRGWGRWVRIIQVITTTLDIIKDDFNIAE